MRRMTEKTPPLKAPLVDLLQYNGITNLGAQIILGTSPDIPPLESRTKVFMK